MIDPDLASLDLALRRVTFRPGGVYMPLRAERIDGVLHVVLGPHETRDSRNEAPMHRESQVPFRGDPRDRESLLVGIVSAVIGDAVHESLEWLRYDGQLMVDPHAPDADLPVTVPGNRPPRGF